MNGSWRRFPRLLKAAFLAWLEDNGPAMGAALAYYTLFSLAPLVVIAVVIASQYFGPAAAEGKLYDQMATTVGPGPASFVQQAVARASHPNSSALAATLSIITLLFGASGVFSNLQQSLNIIWNVPPSKSSTWRAFLRNRLLSFGMVLVAGLLLLLLLLADTAVTIIGRFSWGVMHLPGPLLRYAGKAFSFATLIVLFAAIFKFLPDAAVRWRDALIGALVTALLFVIGESLIGLYLAHSGVTSIYGAAGSLVALLVWVYYSAQILLFGAEFTELYTREQGERGYGTKTTAEEARTSAER